MWRGNLLRMCKQSTRARDPRLEAEHRLGRQAEAEPLRRRPDYLSGELPAWASWHNMQIDHIQPGKPQQSTYVERYNRTVRYAWLAGTNAVRIDRTSAGCGDSMAMEIQSRAPQHGTWRRHPEAAIGPCYPTPLLESVEHGVLPSEQAMLVATVVSSCPSTFTASVI